MQDMRKRRWFALFCLSPPSTLTVNLHRTCNDIGGNWFKIERGLRGKGERDHVIWEFGIKWGVRADGWQWVMRLYYVREIREAEIRFMYSERCVVTGMARQNLWRAWPLPGWGKPTNLLIGEKYIPHNCPVKPTVQTI